MLRLLICTLFIVTSCGFENKLDFQLRSESFPLNSSADIGDLAAQLSTDGAQSCSYDLQNFQDVFTLGSNGLISIIIDNPAQGSYPLSINVTCPPLEARLHTVEIIVDDAGIIIPVLPWHAHFGAVTPVPGGSTAAHDECEGIGEDQLGNVYCAGWTRGNMGEVNAGSADLMIYKLSPEGNLIWMRQFGAVTQFLIGTNGSGDDFCNDIAVDSQGNILCGGRTTSDIGEARGIGFDSFVMKLDTNGNLLWTRQLGADTVIPGGGSEGLDQCFSVDFDSLGNAYCGGLTTGSVGESNGGGQDAFVMKLDSLGNILWLTQLGATTLPNGAGSTSGNESCESIATDSSGNVFCAGGTTGDLGEMNGGGAQMDAFVSKFDPSGNHVWTRQLGTSVNTESADGSCHAVAVDSLDNIYCAGDTQESLAEGNGGGSDLFVTKLDNSTGGIIWIRQLGVATSALGGSNTGNDFCFSLALDSSDTIFCGGHTSGNLGEPSGGSNDAFIAKFDSDGNLQWLTQLGVSNIISGGSNNGSDNCNSVAVDAAGNSFCGGNTQSNYAEGFGGVQDAYIFKLDPSGSIL